MERVKVGIIGAGYIGGVHAAILSRDERVRVAAVHDELSGRAEQLARQSGATVLHEAEELIQKVTPST